MASNHIEHDDEVIGVEMSDASDREYNCPECDCQLETTHSRELAPDYKVSCPACGFSEIWVAG